MPSSVNISGVTAKDQATKILNASAVRFDEPQSLDPSARLRARTNIGLDQVVYVSDYGMSESASASTNTAAFVSALDAVNALGGGIVRLPSGSNIPINAISWGNGTNSAQSTKHNNIIVEGSGGGSGPEVTNTQTNGPTRLVLQASANAALTIAGPLHNVTLRNFCLDANGLAVFSLDVIHVTDFYFEGVVVRGWTGNSYRFTTRTGNPTGVAYGCANGTVKDCYAYDPANNAAGGILLTSGVSGALSGQPDSANIDFYGGVFFYGGSTGSFGIEFAGCDNNTIYGTQFIPKGGNNGGGLSVKFSRWSGDASFPQENRLTAPGLSQPIGGTSGTGGNYIALSTSDGATVPAIDYLVADTFDGARYVDGERVYGFRLWNIVSDTTNRSTTSSSFTNLSGYSATKSVKRACRLRVSFFGLAAQFGTSTGTNFGRLVIAADGSVDSLSQAKISPGDFREVMSVGYFDVSAGSHTITLQGRSEDGTNSVNVAQGRLFIEEMW